MRTEQLHRDKWYDFIHANHICCVIWFLVTVALLAVALVYCVPVWIFDPLTTTCTLQQKNVTDFYIYDDYISWHAFRSEMKVTYQLVDGSLVTSYVYGPSNQADFNLQVAGYSLSEFDVTSFYNDYQIGSSYACYYSKKNIVRVTFDTNPSWAALFVLPCLSLVLAIFVCVYPPLDKLLRNRKKKLERLQLYTEMEEMEAEIDRDILDDDEGSYSVMVASRGGALALKDDVYTVEDDDDDEWIVQEEMIETVGRFFGIQIEDDGQYTENGVKLLQDVEDDVPLNVQISIDEPQEPQSRRESVLQSQPRRSTIVQPPTRSASVIQPQQEILLEMDDIKTDFTDVLDQPEATEDDDWENQPDEPQQPPPPVVQQQTTSNDEDDGEWQ
jgi:hypothetical protein